MQNDLKIHQKINHFINVDAFYVIKMNNYVISEQSLHQQSNEKKRSTNNKKNEKGHENQNQKSNVFERNFDEVHNVSQ